MPAVSSGHRMKSWLSSRDESGVNDRPILSVTSIVSFGLARGHGDASSFSVRRAASAGPIGAADDK